MSRRQTLVTTLAILAIGTLLLTGATSDPSGQQAGDQRIHSAIEILLRVPTGRALLTKALKTWSLAEPHDLISVLRPGETSRTDAILTRHFNPATGSETREREITVYVRTDQSIENMVLDIAHEMVHATSRPVVDPYDPDLTLGRYIKNAIEGEGGEIEAVKTECQVALELSRSLKMNLHRCSDYFSEDSDKIDPERIRDDFYRVGKWASKLQHMLGDEVKLFPEMSPASPRLYSSTGNAPYPAALAEEFRGLTQIACENSKKRLDSVAGRSIASASDTKIGQTFRFMERRCQ